MGFGLLNVPAALAAPVPPADAAEVDDTVVWAKKHPAVLTAKTRQATIKAHVIAGKDPADVFRATLKKGDRFSATLKGSSVSLKLTDAKQHAIKAGRVGKAGDYFAVVTAGSTPPEGVDYALTLKR